MMQNSILATFNSVAHAQAAIDDLLGCDIPAGAIRQFCIPKGVAPLDAIDRRNAFHRPKGTFTWVMDDPPPPDVTGELEVLHYQEGRLAHEHALVVIACSHADQKTVEEVLRTHATLGIDILTLEEVRGKSAARQEHR